jgi:uncharacterized protein
MNAPNPSSERDLEALRRAQRAHEPSMEEILASIRSIIADDREPPATSAPAPKPVAPSGPQIVYANDSIPARPAAPAAQAAPVASAVAAPPRAPAAPAPTPPVEAPAAVVAAPATVVAAAPKVVWEKPAPVAEPVAVIPEPVEEEAFASPATEAAVAASFNALSASIAVQSSEMIEGLMREMLRPMLKSWLDDNLPSLVERLVRAEIQRVARGGR